MKKKRYILIVVILFVILCAICINSICTHEIIFFKENSFCFDEYDLGTTIEENEFYNTDFYSKNLKTQITVYYKLNNSVLKHGIYSMEVNRVDEEDFLNRLYNYLTKVFKDNSDILERLERGWLYFIGNYESIRIIDKNGNVMCINRYSLDQNDESFIVELEIYQGTSFELDESYGGLSIDADICWNAEEHPGQTTHFPELTYFDTKFIRFEDKMVLVDEIEGGDSSVSVNFLTNKNPQAAWYEIADDCNIWGIINQACFGEISYEQLVDSHMSGIEENTWPLWSIGIDESGQIKHIIQHYVP